MGALGIILNGQSLEPALMCIKKHSENTLVTHSNKKLAHQFFLLIQKRVPYINVFSAFFHFYYASF